MICLIFVKKNWDRNLLYSILGYDDGQPVETQDIDSILNKVNLGNYSREEWVNFIETIRTEGL